MNAQIYQPKLQAIVLWLIVGLTFAVNFITTARAHSLSTSYAEFQTANQPKLKLQLALQDLQLALNWSSQRDVTWSMLKKQFPQILTYLQQQLVLHNRQRQPLPCVWLSDLSQWSLTQIQQQYYLQLTLTSDCSEVGWLHYQLFMQLHEHKALVTTAQGESILEQATPWLAL